MGIARPDLRGTTYAARPILRLEVIANAAVA
jgi:hypothetical protein